MKPLKSLIVEDSNEDAELLLHHLSNGGYDVQAEIVRTKADLKTALAKSDWDIILSEYSMPNFTGLDVLSILKENGLDIPIIIISRGIGEDAAVEAMVVGVHDYLMKDNLARLALAINRELENAANRQLQKQAEEALRLSETRLAEAQRMAHIGSWDYDIQNNINFWSDELYRIFDLPKGSLENNPELILGYVHPDDRAAVQSVLDAVYEQGAQYDFENRIIRPDGEERIVHSLGELTFDETGKPLRISGTVQDITERKRAEREKTELVAEVEYQRSRLNNIITSVPGVVWESWGAPGSDTQRIDFVSDYVETLLGYTADEWLSTPNFWHLIMHPDDKEQARLIASENFLNGRNYSQEYRWIAKDERVVWIEANVVIIYDEQNQPVGLRGINLDISRRKQIEVERVQLTAELDMERERLQHILDHAPAFIVSMRGLDFVFEVANPAFYQLVGERELIGIPARTALPGMESQGFIERINDVYQTGEAFVGNEVLAEIRPPGSEEAKRHYLNFVYTPMREIDGSIAGVICYGIDVTEQVVARTKIQESEERYRFLFRNNPLPMWVFDVETLKFLSVNEAAVQHYGYSQEEFLSMSLKDIRPPEDVPAFFENSKKYFPSIDKAGTHRHQKKDGTVIFVEVVSVQLRFNGKNAELVSANDVTERKKAEEALRHAESNYRNLVEASPGIVYRRTPNPPYSTGYISPNVEKYGYPPGDWYAASGMWLNIIYKEDRERVLREFEFAVAQGLETEIEYRIVARDGSIHWWQDKGWFVTDERGKRTGWQGIILDITATKELKEQLRQSQKLESVGLLAGGIAHDFNNMLTAINGYSDLTLRKLKPDDPLRHYLEEIKKAGERSALLTHQLLAFSRQQVLKALVLDLNEVITDTIKMLQRVIGEDIQLTTTLNPKAGQVKIDPGQFSQIIMNLAVNARDAMPQGGTLTIETANVFITPAYTLRHVGFLPGAYVMLTVSDTGSGMSEEIKQHIFEPFFTTKEVGHGTGLGLATVYGIVKQSGGNIEVESREGIGTTFKIYLPRVVESANAARGIETVSKRSVGTETILLVEDEDLVRNLTRQFLQECGYTVIEAGNGVEALSIYEQDCRVDLLMSDVVMPQMGGRELAEKLTDKFSHLKVLFTSGYTDDAVVRHGIIETNSNFIQKPFTLEALADKIRQILDNPS
jgi:PAS domain S-box-containing protein